MQASTMIGFVPLIPLLGFILISVFNNAFSKKTASVIACGAILISFALSIKLFFDLNAHEGVTSITFNAFQWIDVGSLQVAFSFLVDPLSAVMMLVITGVGFLIHIYSIGYMHDDPGHNRFFSYLNLFIFFMLLLVMGSNYLILFIGWEGVGLSSYLLIGFWYKNSEYNLAARKAFIMNRIGDLGLILGMIVIFIQFGSLEYSDVFKQSANLASDPKLITTITLLLFVGAIGKSAQIPLHTWLPDAMAGPTPVSALIHAATMVTAGIYLVARNHILFEASQFTSQMILIIGLATSIMGALTALRQNDIKKVLAYSTVSQLGLLFVALGIHAYSSAMFHLVTHAFFKALLFLGAGSVIHALHGEQDIRKMGGLKKFLPVTWITFAIGTIAISGIPPFSGFFSKDEILLHTYQYGKLIWVLTMFSSVLTAFYMFRLFFLTFWGELRQSESKNIHESPPSMSFPLIALAVLSVLGGLLGIPAIFGGNEALHHFLLPVLQSGTEVHQVHAVSVTEELILMGLAVVLALAAIILAFHLFVRRLDISKLFLAPVGFIKNLLEHKFYFDEIYETLVIKPLMRFSDFLYQFVDQKVIDPVVNNYGFVVEEGSKKFRFFQSGNTGYYLLAMVIGMICLLVTSELIF